MPISPTDAQPGPDGDLALRPFGGAPEAVGPPVPRTPGVDWDTPIEGLSGVGPAVRKRFDRLGIRTLWDLAAHLPVRYLRYDEVARPLGEVQLGEEVTVHVSAGPVRVRPTRRRGLKVVESSIRDATGMATAVWFNQDYVARMIGEGADLLIRGRLESGRPPRFMVKTFEIVEGGGDGLHTTGLVSVYPATDGLPSRRIREFVDGIRRHLGDAREVLPVWIRRRLELPHAGDAFTAVHFPRNTREAMRARRRLAVEELVVMQVGLAAIRRQEESRRPAPSLAGGGMLRGAVRGGLPFALTAEQERVTAEIAADLERTRPMRRLLQGEVGSGKTVIAALAMCQAAEAGRQAALLVPTETLAEQHLRTLDQILAPTGVSPVLITGRVPKAERARRRQALASGAAIAIGTQALLTEHEAFLHLGLVVVDEQHRFGVEQRHVLFDRASDPSDHLSAHMLFMTATPIPRTLALTAYGDLEVSTIRGRPPGRAPVATRWVRDEDREAVYEEIRAELRAGHQAYVICPLVAHGQAAEARSATEEAERLRSGPFADFSVGLAHGAQKPDEKRAAMAAFVSGETDILVATTVVEVGIDVPNATVMVIEDADRFGLAQLHQLRGRVGRGTLPGTCYVLGEPASEDGVRRLEALTQTTDGFRLAELDLDLRGEGAMLGTRQSGATDLRFARLSRDRRELAQARHIARRVLAMDPHLERPEHALLREAVRERFHTLPRLLDA